LYLIIQIPCLNEEGTLAQTLSDLPRSIPGIDTIEYLVIDDGSSDRTVEVAKLSGAHHVLSLGSNRGLATAFRLGVDYALRQGADIVVNTDGDNQYCGEDIAKLVEPILKGQADLVVGCRPIIDHPEFSKIKKLLQLAGSSALRKISKTSVRDAPSGFRAFSKEACMRIFLYTRFSYCMETLIQAGNNAVIRIASVDVRVNPKTRDSRLFSSVPQYLWKTGGTMLSMFILYRPTALFYGLAASFLTGAAALGFRFVYLVYISAPQPGRTYLPSVILLAILAMSGFLMMVVGILAELSRSQRRLTEEALYQSRLLTYGHNEPFSTKA
jgi:glycosyltransferase involved in cell wall biosynthesis